MILDTCFLVDLQREFRNGRPGRATDFLRSNTAIAFRISVISVIEFLEGFADPTEGEPLLRAYHRVDLDSVIASHAATIRRQLRLEGKLIGDFDILIAATALSVNESLVTRNLAEFERVEGLKVIAY